MLSFACGISFFFYSYVAPEVLKNIPYDQSADMWSVGVILFLLLSGTPPFVEDSQSELFRKIRTADWKFRGEEWDGVSSEAKSVVRKLLVANPLQRASAKQALKSRWFRMEDTNDTVEIPTNVSTAMLSTATKTDLRELSRQQFEAGDSDEGEQDGQKAIEHVLNRPEAEELQRLPNGVSTYSMMPADELNGKIEMTKPLVYDAKAKRSEQSGLGREPIQSVDLKEPAKLHVDASPSVNPLEPIPAAEASHLGDGPRRSLDYKLPVSPESRKVSRVTTSPERVSKPTTEESDDENRRAQRRSTMPHNYGGHESPKERRRKDPDGIIPSSESRQSNESDNALHDYRANTKASKSEVQILNVERVRRKHGDKKSRGASSAFERLEI